MKIKAIVISDNPISEEGWDRLRESFNTHNPDLQVERTPAYTPKDVPWAMEFYHLQWNYPWGSQTDDMHSGLIKSPYRTNNHKKVIATALSHYQLWLECRRDREPYIILEHDALWLRPLDFTPEDTDLDIIGLNSPLNATRKPVIFHNIIQENSAQFQPVPRIDDMRIPQGLAGNSAYMIKPAGAKRLLEAARTYGLWPNDALMCYQLIPKMGVTKKYYTKVQGLRSTTTNG